MSLGDHLDVAVDHLDSGLIVDRIDRDRKLSSPLFGIRERGVRVLLVVKMRDQRKVTHSRSMGRDQQPAYFALWGREHDGLRCEHVTAATGRTCVGLCK